MGWKSKLKKTGRGLKKAGKFTAKHAPDVIEVAAPPVLDKLFEKHGDKVESIVTRVDSIAEAVEKATDGVMTKEQADRIEQKLDGITAQIAELRHVLQLSLNIQLGKEGARDDE